MTDSQLADCYRLADDVAPELSGTLQVIEHHPEWPKPATARAYTVTGCMLQIRDYLRSAGEWHGEYRPTIVFCNPESLLLEVMLHETAHLLPMRPPVPDDGKDPTREEIEEEAAFLKTWSTTRTVPVPWKDHEADFIRRALHLHHRALVAGYDIDLQSMHVAGDPYWLAGPLAYRDALDYEPQRMIGCTFAEIESEPMPRRFAQLFAHDVASFHYALTLEKFNARNDR